MQTNTFQQKPPNNSVVTAKTAEMEKENKKQLFSEQKIFLIESETSCFFRLIQKAANSNEITDTEFRQIVRTLTKSQ